MTEKTYVNKAELEECFIVAAVQTGLEMLLPKCSKPMSTYFKTALTNVKKAWEYRLGFVDETEKKKLARRLDHVEITAKQKGVDFSTEEAKATVNENDLMDLAELASEPCWNCTKKEKTCKIAQVFNRLCLPCVGAVKSCRYAISVKESGK